MDGGNMGTGMGSGSDSSTGLSADGVDFNNETQAMNFLSELLDDTTLQVEANQYAQYFWYGVVVVVGLTAINHALVKIKHKMRLREALKGHMDAARPKNALFRGLATVTAIAREVSYHQFNKGISSSWRVPSTGSILMAAGIMVFIVALEFIDQNTPGAQYTQALGIRAAWLAVAQVPLIILLSAKYNFIGLLTGLSYERLNVVHRWSARALLLLATFHFAFLAEGWDQFPNIFNLEWTTDICIPTGLATYAILLWMNISTLAPVRNLWYSFFVFQHIISFFGFIIAVMIHIPTTALYARTYIYISIALYLAERLYRSAIFGYRNMRWARASLFPLEDGVTKIVIKNPRIANWSPGSHVLVRFPSIAMTKAFPATISSTPSSGGGEIVLLLKSNRRFTKSLYSHARKSSASLGSSSSRESSPARPDQTVYTLIDGPYGGKHADFAAFDSVCLLAGSTGITFIISILNDLAWRAEACQGRLPLRQLSVMWCIKRFQNTTWVDKELATAFSKLRAAGIDTSFALHVTCADGSGAPSSDKIEPCCGCDKSLGPCCCTNTEELESQERLLKAISGGGATSEKALGKEKLPSSTITEVGSETASSPGATTCKLHSGRPDPKTIIMQVLDSASGESGVAVCGPSSLGVSVRNAVASLSDERAVHKGTGAQGVYLHVEGFGL